MTGPKRRPALVPLLLVAAVIPLGLPACDGVRSSPPAGATAVAPKQDAGSDANTVTGNAGTPSADGKAGAEMQLRLLRSMPADTLERLAEGGKPDAVGAVGHNRARWMGAQYQRGAMLYFLAAVSHDRADGAEEAWRAAELAFAHQQEDGGFDARNASGTPAAPKDIYSDVAFWLAQFCQAVLVLRASPLGEQFRPRVEALQPRVKKAARLLALGKDDLVAREAPATNRYFIDAVAYALSGILLGDRSLMDTGAQFVDLALRKQDAEGFFAESQGHSTAGGADTSYNCVSIWFLQIYDLYFPSPRSDAALQAAVAWELRHVRDDGEIDATGNTRTGLGQELYFGKPKTINYHEAILALLYFGARHEDSTVLQAARRIYTQKVSR